MKPVNIFPSKNSLFVLTMWLKLKYLLLTGIMRWRFEQMLTFPRLCLHLHRTQPATPPATPRHSVQRVQSIQINPALFVVSTCWTKPCLRHVWSQKAGGPAPSQLGGSSRQKFRNIVIITRQFLSSVALGGDWRLSVLSAETIRKHSTSAQCGPSPDVTCFMAFLTPSAIWPALMVSTCSFQIVCAWNRKGGAEGGADRGRLTSSSLSGTQNVSVSSEMCFVSVQLWFQH